MNDCKHHWIVAAPDGGQTVAGTCRNCGEQRDFAVGGMPTEASKRWMNRPPYGPGWKRRKNHVATQA